MAAILATAEPVRAADWAINLGQWSRHWRGEPDNQTHHLVAVAYRGWTFGGMINSDDKASLLAGYHFRRPLSSWFTPGLRWQC